jgi:hypothetical protein
VPPAGRGLGRVQRHRPVLPLLLLVLGVIVHSDDWPRPHRVVLLLLERWDGRGLRLGGGLWRGRAARRLGRGSVRRGHAGRAGRAGA